MREVDALACTAICLGKQGENMATRVKFRVVFQFREQFGAGNFALIHIRQGDEAPYPVTVGISDDCVIWDVSSADVAKVGTGKCELIYTVGGVIAKSMTYTTRTLSSIGDAGEDPPEPWESWVEEVLAAGAEALAAREEWTNMSATAETLEPGEDATASYSDGVLSLGIPRGEGISKGGTEGQILAKNSDADFDFKWIDAPNSAVWGEIAGDIEDQEDLAAALAEKQPNISDLDDIRDGAEAGATALQPDDIAEWAKAENKPDYDAEEISYGAGSVGDELDGINALIPDDASAANQLVSAQMMGDAIEAVEAKQLYKTNTQGSFGTKAELLSANTFYDAAGAVATPTKNDVAYVLADESHDGKAAKYVIAAVSESGITWGFVITFSSTAFTQEQMDSINSGITSGKVSGYDSHLSNTSNPHSVTKTQVGLGNVANERQYSANNPPPYPVTSVNVQTGAVSLDIPDALSDLSDDSTHRLVTDAEKAAWNAKQNKVSAAVEDDIATLDANGNTKDSGITTDELVFFGDGSLTDPTDPYAKVSELSELSTLVGNKQNKFVYVTVPLSATGWTQSGERYVKTVSVPEILEEQNIAVFPTPTSLYAYGYAAIICADHADGTLTFSAQSAPEDDLVCYVIIFDGGDAV